MYPPGDSELVQIMDAALADATLRAGAWLACRPGCNQCCTGVFRISSLDAVRLQVGLRDLKQRDPVRAAQLRERIACATSQLGLTFPGDSTTGILSATEEAIEAFEGYGDDAVCPVLDPVSGTCNLYDHRPMTCRTFGPPVQTEEGYGVCELCFVGAPPAEVERAELYLPKAQLEQTLIESMGGTGETIVAFAFSRNLI